MHKKWLAPILPYLAVWAGLFLFKSAWGALLGFHLSIALMLLAFRAHLPVKTLFQSNHRKWILASVVICGLSGINLYFFWDIFGVYSSLPGYVKSIGLAGTAWFPFIAYFSLVNPLIEETFWRGFLGDDAQQPYIGDLVYAGYHALVLWGRISPLSVLAALILLTTAGWLWRQIYREDGGLLAPVLGHAAADFTILVCIMLKTT